MVRWGVMRDGRERWNGRSDECRSDSGNWRWTDWRMSGRDEELMTDKMEKMFQRTGRVFRHIQASSRPTRWNFTLMTTRNKQKHKLYLFSSMRFWRHPLTLKGTFRDMWIHDFYLWLRNRRIWGKEPFFCVKYSFHFLLAAGNVDLSFTFPASAKHRCNNVATS